MTDFHFECYKEVLNKISFSKVLKQVAVSELGDSSVKFIILPWVKTGDYWSVKFDLTRKIKEAFDKNNIEIPFPQRAVHIISGGRTN